MFDSPSLATFIRLPGNGLCSNIITWKMKQSSVDELYEMKTKVGFGEDD